MVVLVAKRPAAPDRDEPGVANLREDHRPEALTSRPAAAA
jgi:hypothetical protein